MVPRLLASFVLLLPHAAAQVATPTGPPLPRLMQLGTMPAAAPTLTLLADGSLLGGKGERLDPGQLAAAIAAGTTDLVLRADRGAPASAVLAVLEAARTRAVSTVYFAATLPNGAAGAFALALPAAEHPATTIDLRLHHERPVVPTSSVEPLLRRMQEGWQKGAKTPFVLGVQVADEATCEQMLQVLGAIAAAGVQHLVVTSGSGAEPEVTAATRAGLGALAGQAAPASDGALAMELGPVPRIRVQGAALPQPQPSVRATPFGCLERAQGTAVESQAGGAGGRYGGRMAGRISKGGHPAIAGAIVSGFVRLTSQQQSDGSFAAADGRGDMEATALWMLALLGDGRTLDAGPAAGVLQRGVGWILSQQRADGAFVDAAPGSIGHHALATYALVEAAGLSASGALLRGSAQAGLDWLFAQRQPDGGWNNGLQGVASDPMSTAKSIAAIASAEFFGFAVPMRPSELVGWFDDVVVTETAPTAAALFTRFFAGQDPKQVPAMTTMAGLVGTADPSDPWGAYWTTYALFQMGGRPWTDWQKRLDPAIVKTQIRDGDLEGFWEPAGGCSRLTTTALRLLTLEAYYRYSKLVR
ncbi:MAG TPA: hypothetical protein VFZ65_16595 [Planctomycetota bacterium]|nr:hypothetical protein [Planctomycetota bacterium]